jgi:hypothetical protein
VILTSDSEAAKGSLIRDAIAAIENDKYVAILGIQIGRDHFGRKIENKAVFLHRAGGDMRLSARTGSKSYVSSRMWRNITSQDLVWEAF